MVANYFEGKINQLMKDHFNNAISEIIRAFSVPCTVTYPASKWIDCENCINSINANSPNPFLGLTGKQTTSCNVCGGTRKIQVETTEDVNLALIFDYKKFQQIAGNILVPDGDAQTLSHVGNIKIIKTCKSIVFNTNLEPFNKHSYVRNGEPIPMGFGGDQRFILTTWKVV